MQANRTCFCSMPFQFLMKSCSHLMVPKVSSLLCILQYFCFGITVCLCYMERRYSLQQTARATQWWCAQKTIRKRLFCTLAQHTIYLSPVVVCNTTCQKIPRSDGKWKVPNASYLLHFTTFTQKLFSVSQHSLELI